jgi:transposase-like protein
MPKKIIKPDTVENLDIERIRQKYSNEDKAREFVESLRWPNGPICPHCESTKVYRLTPKPTSKSPGRKGLLKCGSCRKQFTVKVGTIFEDSRIPLSKWVIAIHLLCASKKGMSAHQIHRQLDVTYKSAWFMMHRIRYAMTQEPLCSKLNGTVECDETYIGGKAKNMHKSEREKKIQGRGPVGKAPVVTLVERDGRVKSQYLETVTEANLKEIMQKYIAPSSDIMTDDSKLYTNMGSLFASHESVNHSAGEYVRNNDNGIPAHVNTGESFHSLLKRGVHGVYHHWSVQHLARYLAEFDFRFNLRKSTDGTRTAEAIRAAEGKRLMYKQPVQRD